MAALVAAAGGVELPREVDADAAAIAILLELCMDIDTSVSRHLDVAGMEDVVGKDDYAKTLVFEELLAEAQVDETSCFHLSTAIPYYAELFIKRYRYV